MRRPTATLALPLCLSLAAHALLAYVVVRSRTSAAEQSLAQPAAVRVALSIQSPPVLVAPPPSTVLPPKPKKIPELTHLKSDFGEPDTAGDANHSNPGDEPLRARHAAEQMQAPLAKTPPKPSISNPPLEQRASQPAPRQLLSTKHPAPNIPFGIPSPAVEAVLPKNARQLRDFPDAIALADPAAPAPRSARPIAQDDRTVPARDPKPAQQAPPPPAPVPSPNSAQPQQRAEPSLAGTLSESESDPFSKVANIDFASGRVEASFGRRIKTVRPKILLGGQMEMASRSNPRVLLSAKVDATGHVTDVDVYRSSGSPDLDQPCLIALYDWWFEPPKDKSGRPLPDVVVVAITFHTG